MLLITLTEVVTLILLIFTLGKSVRAVLHKRGRKAGIDLEAQKNVFKKFQSQLGATIPPNNSANSDLYSNIEKEFDFRMSKKAIYMSLTRYYSYFFENETNMSQTIPTDDNDYSDEDSIQSTESEHSVCEILETFNICVDIYYWKKIEPVTCFTKRMNSSCLYYKRQSLQKRKWTDFLRQTIWENTKIKCTWTFKNNTVRRSTKGNISIICHGKCTQCGALLTVHFKNKTDNFVDMVCEISNRNRNLNHNQSIKSRMTNYKVKKLAQKLKTKPAIVVRNSLVNENVTDYEIIEPYYVPNLESLNRLKSRDKIAGLFHNNVLLSLWIMTVTPPYNSLIRNICLTPFVLYYWSDLQLEFFRNYLKSNQTITISIDATGSIFQKFKPPNVNDYVRNTKLKHVFLYVAIAYNNFGSSVPVCQMISTSHTAETIANWLTSWQTVLTVSPNEIIVDDSSALIRAAVESFTTMESTRDYINTCLKILEGLKNVVLPETYIRIDTSHFVKTVHSQKCFQFVENKVKYFYINCIIAIKNTDSYSTVKDILKNIIVTALSKFTDKRCSQAEIYLNHLIHSSKMDTDETDQATPTNDTAKDRDYDDDDVDDCTLIQTWFRENINTEQLYVELSTYDDCARNTNYFPEILDLIYRLLKKIPLWSNVMQKIFRSENTAPSSSNVESYFKNLKTLLFHHKKEKLRVDEFLIKHEDYMAGEVKHAIYNLGLRNPKKKTKTVTIKKCKNQKPKARNHQRKANTHNAKTKAFTLIHNKKTEMFSEDSCFAENPSFIENWGGCSRPQKKEKTLPSPENMHILRNNIWHNQKFVFNTCAFDCVAQYIAVSYLINKTVRKLLAGTDQFSKFIRAIVSNDSNIYALKTNILDLWFYSPSEKELNCECNVTFIIDNIVLNLFKTLWRKICSQTSCSLNRNAVETNGQKSRSSGFIPLDFNILQELGLSALQQAAISGMNLVSPCKKDGCNGLNIFDYTLSDFIAFEFNMPNLKFQINEVPLEVTLCDREYSYPCIIEYIEELHHYRVHTYLGNSKWVTFDDLRKTTEHTNSHLTVLPHCVMYSVKEQ